MRPSNRTKILDAAIRVIHREGVTGVTFDSVAAEASLTRGGLMYHFPSREDLVQAIHQHLADQWESSMAQSVGKPPENATPQERFVAYARTCAQSATRAELLFMLESSTNPQQIAPWEGVIERWAPPSPESVDGAEALSNFVARLAADGLWLYQSLAGRSLPAELRQRVIEHLTDFIKDAPATALQE